MPNKIGTIAYCGYKNIKTRRGTGQLWSFKLEEDGEFYSCGFEKPVRPDGIRLLPGDRVKFQFERTSYGREVDMKSLKVKAVAVPTEEGEYMSKKSFNKKQVSNSSRDEYWENKEKFDKTVTAPLIYKQHCSNIAATLVAQALAKDVLPLPSKKSDKFDAYILCYKQLRDELFKEFAADYKTLGGPDVMEIFGVQEEDEFEDDPSVDDLKEMDDFDETQEQNSDDDEEWD